MAVAKIDVFECDEHLAAAALRAAGLPFLGARQRTPGGRCTMLFDNGLGKGADLLARHNSGELKVSSLAMADSVGAVKNAIFGARG